MVGHPVNLMVQATSCLEPIISSAEHEPVAPDTKFARECSGSAERAPEEVPLQEEDDSVDDSSRQRANSAMTPCSDENDTADGNTRQRANSTITSASHLEVWSDPHETLILFDWDDTLCPTTFVRSDPRLQWSEQAPCFDSDPDMPLRPGGGNDLHRPLSQSGPSHIQTKVGMRDALEQHVQTVIALLNLATELGNVKIVTLAKPEWFESSISNFMPGLAGVFEKLDIEVIYARESLPGRDLARAALDDREVGQVLKTKAISGVIKRFYKTGHRSRSWKNIISIGDSECEKWAVQDVVFRHEQKDRSGLEKRCRCKAVKMLERPDLLFLTGQLQAIISWIAKISSYDGDIDMDLDDILEPSSPTSPLKTFYQVPPDLELADGSS